MLTTRIPISLVVELEKLYPPKCIAPGQDITEAHRYAGMVELVAWLRQHADTQAFNEPVPIDEPEDTDPETGVRTYADIYATIFPDDEVTR